MDFNDFIALLGANGPRASASTVRSYSRATNAHFSVQVPSQVLAHSGGTSSGDGEPARADARGGIAGHSAGDRLGDGRPHGRPSAPPSCCPQGGTAAPSPRSSGLQPGLGFAVEPAGRRGSGAVARGGVAGYSILGRPGDGGQSSPPLCCPQGCTAAPSPRSYGLQPGSGSAVELAGRRATLSL